MNDKNKKLLGWLTLIVISIIPVFLLIFLGDPNFSTYSSATHSFGEIFGLVGMTMFALTFILSTRIKAIEDVFGGLDKVYIVHGILGGTALMLILFHPIFLVLKFVPHALDKAAGYLLPSVYWSTNFGILALTGMIVLIYITLFTKMKYHRWKFTHEFLGLMFTFAVFHIFLVRGNASADNIFNGYYVYAAIVSLIGLSAFSYSLFLKNRLVKNAVYKIDKVINADDLFEIDLIPEHKPIKYKSGQFIYLRFYNEKLSKEPHPFSIASKSNEETIKIVVKKLGDFTKKLEHLKEGDKVSVEGPYGRFNFQKYKDKDQIWIAAGIGITPFLGMVGELENFPDRGKIDLYYTVRDDSDFIGYNQLSETASKIKGFNFIPWNSKNKGRINAQDIEQFSGDLKGKEVFICGPDKFKEDTIIKLIKEGVKKSSVHEEAFNFR